MDRSPRSRLALVIVLVALAAAGIVTLRERPQRQQAEGGRSSQWIVNAGSGEGLCVADADPGGLMPGCYYVTPFSDSRLDRCNYDSGWTIELGGKEDRGRRVFYGTVRSDATGVVATVRGGRLVHAKLLSKPVEKQPYRFFEVKGVRDVEWIDATLIDGQTIRATLSQVTRSLVTQLPRWELPDSRMGWIHRAYAGCPG